MSPILRISATLVFFVAASAGIISCGGSAANSTAVGTGNTALGNASTNSSNYPMLASAVSNAEVTFVDGTTAKIADRKGKVLLINLWGIWCIPCRQEMPHLVAMQNEYRDRGFQVLGLNVGDDFGEVEDVEKIKKFADEMKLNYVLAAISEGLTNEFYRISQGQYVPTSMIIDREGRLRGVFVGGSTKVVTKMKETVAKVIAGEETGGVATEGDPSSTGSSGGTKLELKESSNSAAPKSSEQPTIIESRPPANN